MFKPVGVGFEAQGGSVRSMLLLADPFGPVEKIMPGAQCDIGTLGPLDEAQLVFGFEQAFRLCTQSRDKVHLVALRTNIWLWLSIGNQRQPPQK